MMKKNREKHTDMEQQSIHEWSEKERQVARILLDLPRLWVDRASFTWGRKRKRSAIEDTLYLSSSPQTTPSHHGGGGANRTNGAAVKPKTGPAAAVSPASPASPLSFSRSESDEKLKSKPSLASKREHSLRIVELEDLTKTKESLNQVIDKVKSHYAQLKKFNLKLRERKQQLSNNGFETESESKNPNLELEYGVNCCSNEQKQNCEPSTMANQNHKCGPSEDLRATTSFRVASSVSSSSTLGRVNVGGGPLRPVLDLNLTAGEFIHVGSCRPLDLPLTCYELLDYSMVNKYWSSSKAMAAAQARQRRLQICRLKMKKSIGNSSKSRFSYR